MHQSKTVVIGGLGNPLMSDEGVGIHIIREMANRREQSGNTDLIELGTSSMNVVHAIAGKEKAILIDCALMKEPAGTIRRFTPNDVVSDKNMPRFSLHESDLLDVLHLSKMIGECPDEVVIFGIQPESMEFGEGLSPVILEQMDKYIELIITEL